MKKLVSIVLAVALVMMPILPQTAFAEPLPQYSVYAFSTGNIPTDLRAGGTAAVDVTLAATELGELGYDSVRVNVVVTGPGTAHLLAKDTNGTEFNVAAIGFWGPAGGFLIAKDYSVTTSFTCSFETAGEYTITLSLVDMANGDAVITSKVITIDVLPVAGTIPTVCNALGNDFVTITYDSASKVMNIITHKDRLTNAVKNTALAQRSGAGAYKGLAYEGVDFSAPAGAMQVSVDGDTPEALTGGVFTEWYPVIYAVDPDTHNVIFPFIDANIIQSQDETLAEQLGTTPYELITRKDAGRSLTGSMRLEWLDGSGSLILDETIDFNYIQTQTPESTIPDGSMTAFGSETYSVKAGDKLTMSATTRFPDMSGADPSIYEDGLITLDKEFDNDVTLSLKYNGTPIGAYTLPAGDTNFWVSEFSGMMPRQRLNVQTSGAANTITIEATIPAAECSKTVTVTTRAVAAATGNFDNESDWTKVLASDTATITVLPVPVLAAQDFGVWKTDTVKGYTAGFCLTGADFTGASVVVRLYAGDTLLQTNTAVAGKFDGLTQLSGPFDVYGTFDYAADGYWTNERTSADQTMLPTKVVASVTLPGGKELTAENTNLTGDPVSIVPVHSKYTLSTSSIPAGLHVGDAAAVNVTLAAAEVKDLGYNNVRVNVGVTGPGAAHLLATDTNGHEYDAAATGYWGPAGGFPIGNNYNVTTPFNCSFGAVGTYTITLSLVDMADGEKVITSREVTIDVQAADKNALNVAIDAAQSEHDAAAAGDHPGDYPQSAMDEYQAAIDTAQAVADNANAAQSEVNAAVTALASAISAFDAAVVGQPDKDALGAAISAALAKIGAAVAGDHPTEYPQSAIDAYQDAIEAAQAVSASLDRSQAEVDSEAEALADATTAFDAAEVEQPNKEVLNVAITAAQAGYDAAAAGDHPGEYPQAAIDAYQASISAAQVVYNGSTYSQSEVNAAVAALASAISAFEAAEVGQPDKDALNAAIAAAQSGHDAAAAGDHPGQYPQSAKDTYQNAIDAAKAVSGSLEKSQAEVDAALSALNAATTAFGSAEVGTYTITFHPGSHGTSAETLVLTGFYYGDAFPAAPAVTANEGYTFDGWTGLPATVTGTATYTATYTLVNYTISYNLNSGTVSTANRTSYTVETPSFTLTNPKRTGYTFAGWSGTGITGTAPSVTIAPGSAGSRTYTAVWQKNTAYLTGITCSAGELNRTFSKTRYSYTLTLGEDVGGATITPVRENDLATLTMTAKMAAGTLTSASSLFVPVDHGRSVTVKIVVKFGTTLTKTYTVTVKRAKSTDNTLHTLSVGTETLSPSFDPAVTSYSVSLDENTPSITITDSVDSHAKVTFTSKTYTLDPGEKKTVKITVKSQSGKSKTYKITITRDKSTNADLLSLTANKAAVNVEFDSDTNTYLVTMAHTDSPVTLTAKAAGYKATVVMDGTNNKTKLKIRIGSEEVFVFSIYVTSQSGTNHKLYLVFVACT